MSNPSNAPRSEVVTAGGDVLTVGRERSPGEREAWNKVQEILGGRERGRVEDKRRRFGRFIGLRGMESAAGEGGMREEMEAWVRWEMERRGRKGGEGKGWRGLGGG